MNIIIILVCKIGIFLSKLGGRGSTFPGFFARKLNRKIITYFKLPKTVIFVTGTNGKSTIKTTLAEIYQESGLKVGYNKMGSNITDAVITCFIENSNLRGKIITDVIIIEIDERYVKEVFKDITPTHFIINNISRDQPPRQGHVDFIFEEIQKGINKNMHLILNADDPIINKYSINHTGKITYYGLKKNKYSQEYNDYDFADNIDMVYCPICHNKLNFDYVHYGNIGSYSCKNNHFERSIPNFEAELITDTSFKLDNYTINMPNHFLYNIYNLSACYATAVTDGLDKNIVVKTLNNLKFKRIDSIKIKNNDCYFLLSKNENAISYNQSLNYIQKVNNYKTVVMGFERISRRYIANDLSWLWDINFEILNDKSITKIVCVGKFAYDLAVRIKYANLNNIPVEICLDSDKILDYIKDSTNDIYCMFCFELENKVKNLIKEAE